MIRQMRQNGELQIGGFVPLTTVEWEDRLCAVVFVQGCPWCCPYCHNPGLIPRVPGTISWATLADLLAERAGFLDAVVFSGGEPTCQDALPAALAQVRQMGFATSVHTNGCNPELLEAILAEGLAGHLAMDVKAPVEKYAHVTGVGESGWAAARSIEVIIGSGIDHEFRTTWHPDLLDIDDLRAIAEWLSRSGARSYYIQQFRAEGCAAAELVASDALPAEIPASLARDLQAAFPRFGVRSAKG